MSKSSAGETVTGGVLIRPGPLNLAESVSSSFSERPVANSCSTGSGALPDRQMHALPHRQTDTLNIILVEKFVFVEG